MGSLKSYVLLAFSAVLVFRAWAGSKTVNGLSFELSPPPKQQCQFQPFRVWHEPDPFFKNLKQVKSKGALQYRRGHDIVANYPDFTTVRVEFWQGEFNSCSALPAFDPARLKFNFEWQNASQTVPAKGKIVRWQESSPQIWCEDKCSGRWAYELRIESQDIPLQDNLVLIIEAQDGRRLAEYIGKLSTENFQGQQHPFNIPVSQ